MSVPARADLDALAETIIEGAGQMEAGAHDYWAGAVKAGAAAIKAKAALGRGQWGAWITDNCGGLSVRHVQRMMKAARSGLTAEQFIQRGGYRALARSVSRRKTDRKNDTVSQTDHREIYPSMTRRKTLRDVLEEKDRELAHRELEIDANRHEIDVLRARVLEQEADGNPELAREVETLRARVADLERRLEEKARLLREYVGRFGILRPDARGGAVVLTPPATEVGTTTKDGSEARPTDPRAGDRQGLFPGFNDRPSPYDEGL
ncbi:MAG: hypothetical protein OXI50_12325 [Gammaproteobacteria bacterium]|nr:hypothetical protein [Gammaproteobacteria bacterium]MYC99176.1 hypothetical protein [Gammaproteobacteria bacterium]